MILIKLIIIKFSKNQKLLKIKIYIIKLFQFIVVRKKEKYIDCYSLNEKRKQIS